MNSQDRRDGYWKYEKSNLFSDPSFLKHEMRRIGRIQEEIVGFLCYELFLLFYKILHV
jgi:hypothetical protein